MAKVLWAADRRVTKDDGTLATSGTLTVRLADTSTTATAYTDRALSTEQSVFNIGSDGFLTGRPTIYGADDVGYDAYVQSTGVNGGAWTIPDLSIAETSASDVTDSAAAFKNLVSNGAFDLWSSTTTWSNISGDNDGDETALGWFFAQPSAASNAVSRQTALRTGARYGLRFGRPNASASTNKLRIWGMLATEAAIRARGQVVTISFNAHKGADFSGGSLAVKIATGTAAGEDGDNIESGGFTGHATPLNTAQSLDTATARYEFQATIGSTVSELGFQFAYTPAGAAGADDWVQVEDVQIEIAEEATAFVSTPEPVSYLIEELSTYGRQLLGLTALSGAVSLSGTTLSVTAANILAQLLTVDGSGSGIDADLLDGQNGAYYLPAGSYTASDVLAKLLTVDGAGSGVDADLLDGNSSAYFLSAATYTAADVLAKLLTVDGAGSGLDADTLDGVHIGTSGDTAPKNNTSNTFSATQTINVSGGTSALSVGGTNDQTSQISILNNAGQQRALRFQTGGTRRWIMQADAVAEGGANGGSNFGLTSYDDAGNSLGGALYIVRSSLTATFGGVVLVPAGSAAAPSVAGSGDPNTGVYYPGSDVLAFTTAGALKWTIASGGAFVSNASGAIVYTADGSAATPAFNFVNDQDNGAYRIGTNNWGLSVGGVLALDISTSRMLLGVGQDLRLPDTRVAPTGVNSVGYRGSPVIDGNAAYAFPAADAGCTIYHDEAGTRTYTIPANASVPHPIGTIFAISNTGNAGAAGTITLAITSDTLRRADGTAGTGSRTIAASQKVTIQKVASTVWEISGSFS
jgi:hypothetical protein